MSWRGGWTGAWFGAWFGPIGGYLPVTDTDVLQKPVDFYLHDYPLYRERGREYEIGPRRVTETTAVASSPPRRLSGRPGFTVKTDNKGY